MSSNRNPPPGAAVPGPPNMPPTGPILRTSSYSLRFSGSPTTSYAADTSLKRSSAAVSSGLVSGWYCRESFRRAS